jgi:hypothetical protein
MEIRMTPSPVLRMLVTIGLVAIPGLAAAQDWQVSPYDDGSYFTHSLFGPKPGFTLQCGERSAQGLSPMATGNTTPLITQAGTLRIGFGPEALGVPQAQFQRDDVMIVIGTAGFQVPQLTWDELDWRWSVDLAARDPVFVQLGGVETFGIYTGADQQMRQVSARGFGLGLAQLTQLCSAGFAAIGQAWDTGAQAQPAPAPPPPSGPMEARARAAILDGCGGPADIGPTGFLRGQIDADGVEDVVLNWGDITCRADSSRPFCGASMCAADVFLSALGGVPETLLAVGVRLQPLSNGLQAVATGGSLAMCQERGASACEFLWYWTGSGLDELR